MQDAFVILKNIRFHKDKTSKVKLSGWKYLEAAFKPLGEIYFCI